MVVTNQYTNQSSHVTQMSISHFLLLYSVVVYSKYVAKKRDIKLTFKSTVKPV